jgi:peroxiredoxin
MSAKSRQRAARRTTRHSLPSGARPGSRGPTTSVTSSARGTTAIPAQHSTSSAPTRAQQPAALRYARLARQRRRNLLLKVGGAIAVGVALLGIIFLANRGESATATPGRAGQFRFDVANPATGALAPDFALPATTGGTVRLSDYRGKNVLLYFQEGIGCEGCWTQMKDIQTAMADFRGLSIESMVTITTNPLGALKQKATDEGITLPVLSDVSFVVSRAYNATAYGMMAGSADGHTFILVGPDGRIRWRADYGGPPDYTMYVPVSNLIADIKAGTGQ